ncbi:MAG: GntR family transcriptional regulator [Lachnospiraceae bacterium]|nr:GntR family transcriptional regulator [Lachnospiraceae bacterium]
MIQINYQDKRPIYEQVTDKIRRLIVTGVLPPEEKIPSVRSLAIDLSINPNTIQKAYQELERLGFVYTVKGRGNFVSPREQWAEGVSEELLGRFRSCVRELSAVGMKTDEIVGIVREETDHTAKETTDSKGEKGKKP